MKTTMELYNLKSEKTVQAMGSTSLFDCEKSTKPTAAPLLSQPIFELHLRVEFKIQNQIKIGNYIKQ
jgi:hypothetical protein